MGFLPHYDIQTMFNALFDSYCTQYSSMSTTPSIYSAHSRAIAISSEILSSLDVACRPDHSVGQHRIPGRAVTVRPAARARLSVCVAVVRPGRREYLAATE